MKTRSLTMGRGARFLIAVLAATAGLSLHAHAATAGVRINEVSCQGTDWIELFNDGAGAVDLEGWELSDAGGGAFEFPDGTGIPAHGRVALTRNEPGSFTFGISCDDAIRLLAPAGALVERMPLPELFDPGDTWGRYPDGGGLAETLPTKDAPNAASPAVAPADEAEELFDPFTVSAIDLDLEPSAIAALLAEPEENVEGQFSLQTEDGTTHGPLTVGVRLKGHGSFRPITQKAAFKIEFDEFEDDQSLLGLDELTLNNMVQDETMARERLAYEIARAAGIAAPRTGYSYVRLNGENLGIYLNVETIDFRFLSRHLGHTQHLYEGELGADVVEGAPAFDIDEGNEDDLADLDSLIAAVEADGDFSDNVSGIADLQQMARLWAFEKYIGHWDGYAFDYEDELHPNNYFLHSDPNGFFRMLPWGVDQALIFRVPFEESGGRMFSACISDPSCRDDYRAGMLEVLNAARALPLDLLLSYTREMLEPWRAISPSREEHDPEVVEEKIAVTRAFIADREADAVSYLGLDVAAVPDTAITKAPKSRGRARRVGFRFESTAPGATFECRLDRGAFAPCASPKRLKVSPGRHRFRVRALLPGVAVDPSPAVDRFEILRGPRKRR
jgi:hypothetical protein